LYYNYYYSHIAVVCDTRIIILEVIVTACVPDDNDNSQTTTTRITDVTCELKPICQNHTRHLITSISCHGNRLCVTDKLDSVIIFAFREHERKLEFLQA